MTDAKADEQICPDCQASFACGFLAGLDRCWCQALPAKAPPEPQRAACYCPECLSKRIARTPDPA